MQKIDKEKPINGQLGIPRKLEMKGKFKNMIEETLQ